MIDHPITLFGKGHQKRGFLPLRDSMQCPGLSIENPPEEGEYRVLIQFKEVYGVTDLANKIKRIGDSLGLTVEVSNIENPRLELEEHYYNPDHQHLLDLGYQPAHEVEPEMKIMMQDLLKYRDKIKKFRDVLIPDIRWDGTRRTSEFLEGVAESP